MRKEKSFRNSWNAESNNSFRREHKYFNKFKDREVKRKKQRQKDYQTNKHSDNDQIQRYIRNPFTGKAHNTKNYIDIEQSKRQNSIQHKHDTEQLWQFNDMGAQRRSTKTHPSQKMHQNLSKNITEKTIEMSSTSSSTNKCHENLCLPKEPYNEKDLSIKIERDEPIERPICLVVDISDHEESSKPQKISHKEVIRKNSFSDQVSVITSKEDPQLEDICISRSSTATQTEQPAKKVRNKKKSTNICKLCDTIGHTEYQCLMICKNCNQPYHNMRTCSLPNQSHTTLTTFLEFCINQFNNSDL